MWAVCCSVDLVSVSVGFVTVNFELQEEVQRAVFDEAWLNMSRRSNSKVEIRDSVPSFPLVKISQSTKPIVSFRESFEMGVSLKL